MYLAHADNLTVGILAIGFTAAVACLASIELYWRLCDWLANRNQPRDPYDGSTVDHYTGRP